MTSLIYFALFSFQEVLSMLSCPYIVLTISNGHFKVFTGMIIAVVMML